MLGHIHCSFHLVVLQVWCMSFYEIILSQMILQMALICFKIMRAHYLCTMCSVQFKCKSKIIWTIWTNVSHPPYVKSMFKKLLGVRSFNIRVGHLACHWVILFTSSKGLYLPSMVQLVAPTFLGCWTLIILALITHFQQDDHPILFDVVTHVATNIFPLQLALWDTQALLI